MAILKVARLGNPVLRKIAAPVSPEAIGAPSTQQLIDDLIETMVEYDGAGLAAPQVHVSKQIVVFEVEGNPRYPDAESIPLTVLINPKITPTTQQVDEDWEGCLSVPDLRGKVPRYTQVRIEAYDRHGKKLNYVAKDFHARVVQHECDHLIGKVFLDRMRSMESLSFIREFMRYSAARD
ncbi:MAG TPA: peptide deformylase [Candidatus Margulisiibacteriota bacterium]|nr:peptide deformylase [Candidatus Margulisiibacteriota bacterium]